MTASLLAELERQQSKVHTAYRRFTMAATLIPRRGLSTSEAATAKAIHDEALELLTLSLPRVSEICEALYGTSDLDRDRRPAARYSSDLRRGHF